MFTTSKDVDNISKLYVDTNTNKLINPSFGKLDFRNLCKPDMEWVHDKCMMKSHKYKEVLEENYKMLYLLNPEQKKDEETEAKTKKRIFNSYNSENYADDRTKNQLFLNCSQLYYEQCRDFYQKRLK
jgi:hypothetical protein